MSVNISALGASEVWMGGQKVWSSDTKAQVAPVPEEPYYAPGATDVREPTAAKVVYTPESPSSAASVVPYTMLPQATPQPLARRQGLGRRPLGIPWGKVGIAAAVVAVTGAVAYMLFKPTRGFKTATAGIAGYRRSRRRHRR